MSLANYLAKNYLTADSKTEKKSKIHKRKEASDGLIIADDNSLGWDSNDGPLMLDRRGITKVPANAYPAQTEAPA